MDCLAGKETRFKLVMVVNTVVIGPWELLFVNLTLMEKEQEFINGSTLTNTTEKVRTQTILILAPKFQQINS